MGKERIVYQDWIVALGRDPSLTWQEAVSSGGSYNTAIITAVGKALSSLSEEEAAFIRLFYFQGLGYREISEKTNRQIYRLEALHESAVRKLKIRLHRFLGNSFDISSPVKYADCPLCNHPERGEIDRLIRTKTAAETWKRIIKTLRDEYGLSIVTPQRLIGHRKYHMI
jgi:hypothetical protein